MPTLNFTSGADNYTVNSGGPWTLNFLGGDDILSVSGGSFTTASMGAGNDLARLLVGDALVRGEAGNDRFEIYQSGVEVQGGDDADLFNVRGAADLQLDGGLGVDRFNFHSTSSNAFVRGGAGSDVFYGYNQSISGQIFGDGGNDYFVQFRATPTHSVTITGGAGDDIFRADATNPVIFFEFANEGVDAVQVARGASYVLPTNVENISVQGFSGSNTATQAFLMGNELANSIIAHNNDDQIQGMLGNDKLFGKGGSDWLMGGSGADRLDGGDGDDELTGDGGADILYGGAGGDAMSGGNGDDTYYVDDDDLDQITEDPDEGIDLVRFISQDIYDDWTMPANVENLIQMIGTTHLGLHGNGLDNHMTGSSDGDDFYGGGGNDILSGGAGGDWFYGEAGADRLRGGADNDRFSYRFTTDSPVGSGADLIVDFSGQSGEGGDILDLGEMDAIIGGADDDFHYVGSAGNGDFGALWITYGDALPAGGFEIHVFGDINGDYMEDFEIVLHGNLFLDDIVY